MKKLAIAIFIATLLPSLSFASIDTNLKYGMKNTEVSELQDFLVDKGYMNTSTGFFGLLTLKAVQKYQADNGISSTGYVGILTRTQINKELEVATQDSTQAEISETGTTTSAVTACGNGEIYNIFNGHLCNPPQATQTVVNTSSNTGGVVIPVQPTYTIENPSVIVESDGTHELLFPISNNPKFVTGSLNGVQTSQDGSNNYSGGRNLEKTADGYIWDLGSMKSGTYSYTIKVYGNSQPDAFGNGNVDATSVGSFTISQ